MVDNFNMKPEREGSIEGLSLGSSIAKVRMATEDERDNYSGIMCELRYVVELGEPGFPTREVLLGDSGTCYAMGDSIIFDVRRGKETAKHEMVHSWYDTLYAEQLRDLLDTVREHDGEHLHNNVARSRTAQCPRVSYWALEKYMEQDRLSGIEGTHPLTEEVKSLEEAVAMEPGTIVDNVFDWKGEKRLSRYMKVNDCYRQGDTLGDDEPDDEKARFISGAKEEFIDVVATGDEYFAYELMKSDPWVPVQILEAAERNGFDNDLYERVAGEVFDVAVQLENMEGDRESPQLQVA